MQDAGGKIPLCAGPELSELFAQPFGQQRRTRLEPAVLHRHPDRPAAADQNQQLLRPGHGGVKQIPLQHHVMLGQERQHDDREFAALRLVHGHRVGERQLVRLVKRVVD